MKKTVLGVCIAALVLCAACPTDDDDEVRLPPKIPKTWGTVSGIKATANIYRVAYGNGVFVATGQIGSSDEGYAAWSKTGLSWTEITDTQILALLGARPYVYFGNGYFIAPEGRSGSTAGKNWAMSEDGETWTAIGDGNNFGSQAPGIYANGKWFIGGSNGNLAWASDPAGTWTFKDAAVTNIQQGTGTSGADNRWINAVAYGNNTYVVGGGLGQITWSTDLTTWTASTAANGNPVANIFDNASVSDIVFGRDRFVAFGGQDNSPNKTKVAWSKDGKSWTESDLTYTAGQASGARYCQAVYNDGLFVMVARDCSVSYSTDNGVTWTETNPVPFESQVPYGICFGNGKYVVVGANGKIAYSFPE